MRSRWQEGLPDTPPGVVVVIDVRERGDNRTLVRGATFERMPPRVWNDAECRYDGPPESCRVLKDGKWAVDYCKCPDEFEWRPAQATDAR